MDWLDGEFDFARADSTPEMGLYLDDGQHTGSYISTEQTSPLPTNEVVLSVNVAAADLPECGLVAQVSCRKRSSGWSSWFDMLRWQYEGATGGVTVDDDGQVDIDVLKLQHVADTWRYRIMWHDPGGAMRIRRVALSLYADTGSREAAPDEAAPIERLQVPFYSQWEIDGYPPDRVCSPTALAMVARYFGIDTTPEATTALAHDAAHDIYGNWSMNMLAASRLGLDAYIDRGSDLGYLQAAVRKGRPVIVSIAYGAGDLTGAPVPASKGHLVVVAGFDQDGGVIVRDPAARGDDLWLTYRRDQFAHAWLGHGGVVYWISSRRRP